MGTKATIKKNWPPHSDDALALIGRICDTLRFSHGMNHEDIRVFFADAIGESISKPRWDEVMFEIDYMGL